MAALVRALQDMNPPPFAFHPISLQAEPFASLKGRPADFDSTLRDVVESLPVRQRNPDLLVTVLGGNEHTIFGLLQPPTGPIDFVFGDKPSLPTDPDAELLSESQMAAQLEARLRRCKRMLGQLKSLFGCPVIQLQAPPPLLSNEYILHNLDPYFRKNFEDPVVAAPTLRLKLWLLVSKLMREACRSTGVNFLACPAASQTANGFLDPQFNGRNATHANARYGALLVEQISKILEARGALSLPSPAHQFRAGSSLLEDARGFPDEFWTKMEEAAAVICDEEALDIADAVVRPIVVSESPAGE